MEKDSADAVAATILAAIKYTKSYESGDSLIESVIDDISKKSSDEDNWLLDEEYTVYGDSEIFY